MDQKLQRMAEVLRGIRLASEFSPASVPGDLLPHVFVIEIENNPGAARLRIRLVGTALDTAFQRPVSGHYLEHFIHGPRGDDVLAGFQQCADDRAPVWMRQIVQIRDQRPRFVEGIVFYLDPARLCGGLVIGELSRDVTRGGFERVLL